MTRATNPTLRPVGQQVLVLTWCFARAGWVVFWLLQGERDLGAKEAECFPLGAGGLGEHRHGGAGAGEPDLVAGQGGQVLQQVAEAAVGLPGRVMLAGGLGLRGRGTAGRATGLPGVGGCSSVKVSGAQAWRRCQVR
jgi:hypothetical protein